MFVCILPGKAISEMMYTVSVGQDVKPYLLTHSSCSGCVLRPLWLRYAHRQQVDYSCAKDKLL